MLKKKFIINWYKEVIRHCVSCNNSQFYLYIIYHNYLVNCRLMKSHSQLKDGRECIHVAQSFKAVNFWPISVLLENNINEYEKVTFFSLVHLLP